MTRDTVAVVYSLSCLVFTHRSDQNGERPEMRGRAHWEPDFGVPAIQSHWNRERRHQAQ
jgi:hypothetical protein